MNIEHNLAFAAAVLMANVMPAYGQASIEAWLSTKQPIVIAHRSADINGHPENSLAWIEAAIAAGIDMIHLNPQQTADDGYVLMHDPTLNRTTDVQEVYPTGAPAGPSRVARGGKDFVRDYTLAAITSLNLDGTTGQVPTLSEGLETAKGKIMVMLGLKSYEVESLSSVLAKHDTDNLVLMELYYSGTDQSKLRTLSEATGIPIMIGLYNTRDAAKDLEDVAAQLGPMLKAVNVKSVRITPEFSKRADELGVIINISGWNGPEDSALSRNNDITLWEASSAVGIGKITDYPLSLIEARN